MVLGQRKLIHYEGGYELYDLREDPTERDDQEQLAPQEDLLALTRLLPPLGLDSLDEGAAPKPVSEREKQMLRELGYVE